MGIVSDFSSPFLVQEIGVITGSFAAVRFPDIPAKLARLEGRSSNAGSFFITTDPTYLGFEIDAGQDTGWFACQNLNELYHQRSSGTSDYLAYWVQK